MAIVDLVRRQPTRARLRGRDERALARRESVRAVVGGNHPPIIAMGCDSETVSVR
jgi:hypothetical protein